MAELYGFKLVYGLGKPDKDIETPAFKIFFLKTNILCCSIVKRKNKKIQQSEKIVYKKLESAF
jgi:hypothetical protein